MNGFGLQCISKNSLTSTTFSYGTSKSRAETVPAEDSEHVHPPKEALHLTSCGCSLHTCMPEVTLSPVPPGVSFALHCPFFHRVLVDPGFFLDSVYMAPGTHLCICPGSLLLSAQRLRDSIVQESRVTLAYLGSHLGVETTGVGEFGPMLCTVSLNPRVGTLSSKVMVLGGRPGVTSGAPEWDQCPCKGLCRPPSPPPCEARGDASMNQEADLPGLGLRHPASKG